MNSTFIILILLINFCNIILVQLNTLNSDRENSHDNDDDVNQFNRIKQFEIIRADENITYRLPEHTKPIAYDISLITWINNADFRFSGLVKIEIEIVNETNEIILHHRQLDILSVNLYNQQNEINIVYDYDNVTEFLRVTALVEPLQSPFIYTLEISYTGVLRTDNKGFYRSSYQNSDGEQV